jgi:F420H(2)-dependent quinone reductase
VSARAVEGEERARLWAKWRDIDKQLDGYATLRSSETAVVILEPQPKPFP